MTHPYSRWPLASCAARLALTGLLAGLAGCGGGGDTASEPDWTADAKRAAVSALTVPAADGSHTLTLAWTDTLDGEQGWRVEAQQGGTWQALANVAASPGRGQTLSISRSITTDTVLRVLAVLPDDQTVPASTAGQLTQLQARTSLPGASVTLAGTDQPLSGDTRIGLDGAPGLLSAQYSAVALADGAAGDGLLGTPLTRSGPQFTVPWRSGMLNDGRYRINAKLEFEPGNFIVLQRVVDVHNSGLQVGVAAAVSGREVTLRLQLRSNVTRPAFTVQVDGALVSTQTLASGWQVRDLAVPLGELSPGDHEIIVQASDSSGARAQARTTVRVGGELQARLDVPDGAPAFDTLAISGFAGVPGSTRPMSVRLTLDQTLIYTGAGGSFSFRHDLAGLSSGPHTLTLEVLEAGGRRASVSSRIEVRTLSPAFQRIKTIQRGERAPTTWTGVASNGRIALSSLAGCAAAGGRSCIDVTTVDPDTPQDQVAYGRSIGVSMNPDWTFVSIFDGATANKYLLAAPGNPIAPNYGTCRAPGANPQCRRWPEGLAIKEWAVVSDVESFFVVGVRPVFRNMLTGEERPVPGSFVSTIPVQPSAAGGWLWTIETPAGYAVYDSVSGTSTPLSFPGGATQLASDGRRLVWLAPADSAASGRRKLYTALPGATQSPQLLADYLLTAVGAQGGERTRAGGGWVVWAERNSATGLDLLRADNGNGTLEIARAPEIRIQGFDSGAVLWWDGARTRLWAPGRGVQTVAMSPIGPVMTQGGLYLILEDSALHGLRY